MANMTQDQLATGSDQLCYHGKHCYLSTAKFHARHNYYKILFSHINYLGAPIKKKKHNLLSMCFVNFCLPNLFSTNYPPFSQFMQLFEC